MLGAIRWNSALTAENSPIKDGADRQSGLQYKVQHGVLGNVIIGDAGNPDCAKVFPGNIMRRQNAQHLMISTSVFWGMDEPDIHLKEPDRGMP